MSDSTRYFQLTPNILVEYSCNNLSNSNKPEYMLDLKNDAYIVNNGYCATRTLLYKKANEGFVQPINKSESKFIHPVDTNWGFGSFNCDNIFNSGKEDSDPDLDLDNDVLKDTFKLHFTSRNYFGDYDGLIITINIYDKIKNKIGILSQYIKRTDDPNLNPNPVLINQKLYTTYKDFVIPSISAIIRYVEMQEGDAKTNAGIINGVLSQNYDIMENTPVIMSIYGVKSTYVSNGAEYYNTEKLNTIFIPLEDKSNRVEIKCVEADDGDYFKIYPEVDNGTTSFSDYIYNISDGSPENYIVFYELTLIEHYTVGNPLQNQDKITHREQYIINVAQHSDEADEIFKTNKGELDSIMYYRPIIINSGKAVTFTINVKLHIINTLDNTTIIKKGDFQGDIDHTKRYGKTMNRIYLGDIPAKINVYNRKPDIEKDGVKIINSGGTNIKIENHQHSVIGFIECANVGVSIEQIPKEDIQ